MSNLEALIKRLDDALSFGTTGRDALPNLLKDCKAELESRRYEEIEHEHLGCHVAKTGIYADKSASDGPSREVTPAMIKAARAFRVNLQFGDQGISGPLSPFEVKEIWERMYDASSTR